MKLWDVLAPHFAADLPASLSSAARVRGPWSAGLWAGGELAAVAAIALLRIPGLSPSSGRIVALVPLLVVWNTICWFLAEVSGALNGRSGVAVGVATIVANISAPCIRSQGQHVW